MRIAMLTTDGRDWSRNYSVVDPWFGTAPQALLDGFLQLPDCQIHVVSCSQRPMQSPEKLAPNIWFHSVNAPKWGWLRTGYLGCIRAVRKKLGEIQPDIVHGQGTERDCALTAALSGFPNVVTIHGNMRELARLQHSHFPQYTRCAAVLEAVALRKTKGVFCNSAYTESLVRPVARKTWRVPNALRREFFDQPPSRQSNSCPVILNVGVISPRKRQCEVLGMAEQLHASGLRFRLEFVGECGDDAYGREFQRKLSSAGAFALYRGIMGVKELIQAYDQADGLVHFPEEEAFGLVVGEAMSRGLKFFGSRVGGIVEIAEGVRDAELVASDAGQELTDRIKAWILDGFPRSAEGPLVMEARYSPGVIARRHLEIYQEVLFGQSGYHS